MDVLGVRVVFSPAAGVTALAFVLAGVAVGTVSGLTPGLHVNALAMLIAVAAPSIPGPPHLVGAALLAAGVTHSFLDVVPSLALGVPDAAMAVSALPGHRLVLAGRGREALRLSALGSASAVALAFVAGLPVTVAMTHAYPVIRRFLPVVLVVVVLVLLAGERSSRARGGALLSLAASGALGAVVLDVTPHGVLPVSDLLLPVFAGLFGVPVLLVAARGSGVPPQGDATVAASRREVGAAAFAGASAGGIVGYVPGVSSAIAAVLALGAIPGDAGDRGFIVAVSGVNTSNTIFALFALVALGSPRTGVLVAYERARLPLNLPLLLVAVALAGVAGTLLVLALGDYALAVTGRLDHRRLTVAVLALLVVLAALFAGPLGVLVLAASTLVGTIPQKTGARRVHLMGVLVVPLALGLS